MTVVLAVTSDQHANSTVALCPPKVALDDGGTYERSKVQAWYWENWLDFHEQVADTVRKHRKAPLFYVGNGDLVEGDHHNTSQIVSRNPTTQAAIIDAVLKVPLALKPNKLFFTRGTETHVGQSAATEEAIARGLRSAGHPVQSEPETGNAAWWHIRAEIEGVMLDITHHGRTGGREHTRANAANLHAFDIYLSHKVREERHPDLCIRAHHHRFNDSYGACPTRVITSGAWQAGRTGHVKKKVPDTVADCGGYIIVIDGGEYDVKPIKYNVSRGPIWRDEPSK